MGKVRTAILAATIFLTTSLGSAFATQVQVFSDWARGDFGTAHNATNGQYIYCWVSGDNGASDIDQPMLYCEAYDGTGALSFCYSINSTLVGIASGISSESHVEFGWVEGGHTCSFLMVKHTSEAPGRKP
jgi:hypothetical protein